MSQRRILPILAPIMAVIKNKSQNPGHQRSDLVHAKSADVVQFENVTPSSDFPSQKSGQGLSLDIHVIDSSFRSSPSSDRFRG